jgi:hypothetical protein
MRRNMLPMLGFGLVAALAATPAFAGTVGAPEPEVAGGLIALGAMGIGYRFLSRRFKR